MLFPLLKQRYTNLCLQFLNFCVAGGVTDHCKCYSLNSVSIDLALSSSTFLQRVNSSFTTFYRYLVVSSSKDIDFSIHRTFNIVFKHTADS